MAKLSQCIKCKKYQEKSNICTNTWKEIDFDDTPCSVLSENTQNVDTISDKQQSSDIFKQVKKRKEGHNTQKNIPNDKIVDADLLETEIVEEHKHLHVFFISVICLILLGLGVGAYYYIWQKQMVEKRGIVVNSVNSIIQEIQEDKTLGSIKIIDYNFHGDTLMVNYWADRSVMDMIKNDSLEQEFMYMVLLHRDQWRSIVHVIDDMPIKVTAFFDINRLNRGKQLGGKYSMNHLNNHADTLHFTTTIAHIDSIIKDPLLFSKAMEVFANRKLIDIKEYVIKHFGNNGLLKFHDIRLDKDFVRLTLAYDDSKMKIGGTYLDSIRINPNFTDKVDERGSILRELFSICSRTHRGFSIEYRGTRKNTRNSISWNYKRAMGFKESFYLGVDPNQKTNQWSVVTVSK